MIEAVINRITKKKTYNYFFIKLFMFLILVYVFDFTLGKILNFYYFKQESGLQYRTTFSIEKTTADILIFGSSRANHHYNPVIIENKLKSTVYNVGRDGSSIFYQYAILKGILKRYTPKIVILDFESFEFKYSRESYDRLSSLLPYYKSHPELHSIIELKSTFEKYKMFSNIYPFNSSIFTIAIGNTKKNKKRRGDIKGYIPLYKIWRNPIKNLRLIRKYEYDKNKIVFYKNFINDCIQKKIKLFIFVSPYFTKTNRLDYSILTGKRIAKKYDVNFYNYSNDKQFLKANTFFADIKHLNNNGAKKFTNIITNKIIEVIN